MPFSCCVPSCFNRPLPRSGRSFHKFPMRNPELVQIWLNRIGRADWIPSKRSVLCSDHFVEAAFDRTGQTNRIRDEAVATIFKMQLRKSTRKRKRNPEAVSSSEKHPRTRLSKNNTKESNSRTQETGNILCSLENASSNKILSSSRLPNIDISHINPELFKDPSCMAKSNMPEKQTHVPPVNNNQINQAEIVPTRKDEPRREIILSIGKLPDTIHDKCDEKRSSRTEETENVLCFVDNVSPNKILSSSSLPNIDISQISPELLKDPSYQSFLLYKASIANSKIRNQEKHALVLNNNNQDSQEEMVPKRMYELKCKQNEDLRKRLNLAYQRIRHLNKTLNDLASAIEGLEKVDGDLDIEDDF